MDTNSHTDILINPVNLLHENPKDVGFNVADEYKNMNVEDINTTLNETRTGLINVFVNLGTDFNLATGIRNSNFYNIKEVIILGKKRWDKRGAVGTQHYTPITHYDTFGEVIKHLRDRNYTLVAAEITETSTPLANHEWDYNTAVFYGEERAGLSPQLLTYMDEIVHLPRRGSVRSLNVSTVSGIITNSYTEIHG